MGQTRRRRRDQYSFYYDDNTSGTFLINDIGGGDDWKQHFLTSNLDLAKNLSGFSIFGSIDEWPGLHRRLHHHAVAGHAALLRESAASWPPAGAADPR